MNPDELYKMQWDQAEKMAKTSGGSALQFMEALQAIDGLKKKLFGANKIPPTNIAEGTKKPKHKITPQQMSEAQAKSLIAKYQSAKSLDEVVTAQLNEQIVQAKTDIETFLDNVNETPYVPPVYPTDNGIGKPKAFAEYMKEASELVAKQDYTSLMPTPLLPTLAAKKAYANEIVNMGFLYGQKPPLQAIPHEATAVSSSGIAVKDAFLQMKKDDFRIVDLRFSYAAAIMVYQVELFLMKGEKIQLTFSKEEIHNIDPVHLASVLRMVKRQIDEDCVLSHDEFAEIVKQHHKNKTYKPYKYPPFPVGVSNEPWGGYDPGGPIVASPKPEPSNDNDIGLEVIKAITKMFPNAETTGTNCPVCKNPGTIIKTIMHMNDLHTQCTREYIADWLETLDVDLQIKENA